MGDDHQSCRRKLFDGLVESLGLRPMNESVAKQLLKSLKVTLTPA